MMPYGRAFRRGRRPLPFEEAPHEGPAARCALPTCLAVGFTAEDNAPAMIETKRQRRQLRARKLNYARLRMCADLEQGQEAGRGACVLLDGRVGARP